MTENVVVRLTRETMDPRSWSGSAITLGFLATPPAIASFLWALESGSPYAPIAAYFPLLLLGALQLMFRAWSSDLTSTKDAMKQILLNPSGRKAEESSGWFVKEIPAQLSVGMAIGAVPILLYWNLAGPGLRSDIPDANLVISFILFTWFVVAPIETFLQAWVWPMTLPFGPVSAQLAFLFLHGQRALDPAFAAVAISLGFAFWVVSYARYIRWRGAPYFGPVAAWAFHATWNSLMLFVALDLPGV